MRVLHIHDHAAYLGGVEQIVHDLAVGLARKGWQQGILFTEGGSEDKFMGPFEWAGMCPIEAMNSYKPDVAVFHKVKNPDVVKRIASRIPGIQMIHDHDLFCPRRHKYFPLSQKICNKPAGINCLSHLCFVERPSRYKKIPVTVFDGIRRQRQGLKAVGDIRRFIVGSQWMLGELVMNGLRKDLVEVVAPIPASVDDVVPSPMAQSREILCVGQIIRGKGIDLLIEAVSLLNQEYKLTIVGKGRQEDEFKSLANSLGVQSHVSFEGWVDHDELERYYQRSQIVVVPSRWPEPFGMVGLEGMIRGRPVVGFSVGGINDWLEDGKTGLLAQPGNAQDLASKLDSLLADYKLSARLGSQAACHVKSQYKHSNFVGAMERILLGVCE